MNFVNHLQVELTLPSDTPHSSAMETAANCVKDLFIPAVDDAVSSFEEELSLYLPRIEIDLGHISPNDIPFKLKYALIDEIRRRIWDARTYSADNQELDEDSQMDVTHLSSDDEVFLNAEERLSEAFLEYLNKGFSDFTVFGVSYSTAQVGEMALQRLDYDSLYLSKLADCYFSSFPLSFFRLDTMFPAERLYKLIIRILSAYDSRSEELVKRVIPSFFESEEDNIRCVLLAASYTGVELPSVEEDNIRCVLLAASIMMYEAHSDTESGFYSNPERKLSEILSEITLIQISEHHSASKLGPDPEKRASARPVDSDPIQLIELHSDQRFSPDLYGKMFEILSNKKSIQMSEHYSGKWSAFRKGSRIGGMLDDVSEVRIHDADIAIDERIHTYDAGLVILHPFFKSLFGRLELIDDNGLFKSAAEQIRAAHILKSIADGYETEYDDNDMLFCKLLCGLSPKIPAMRNFELAVREREEIDALLESLLNYWNPLKADSFDSIRSAFIKRRASIERVPEKFIIHVEGSAVDILMDDLPWEISMIYLPWSEPFYVDWQKEF